MVGLALIKERRKGGREEGREGGRERIAVRFLRLVMRRRKGLCIRVSFFERGGEEI